MLLNNNQLTQIEHAYLEYSTTNTLSIEQLKEEVTPRNMPVLLKC